MDRLLKIIVAILSSCLSAARLSAPKTSVAKLFLVYPILVFLPFFSAQVEDASAAESIEMLRAKVAALEQEAAVLEEQNQGLNRMLKEMDDDAPYIVVDTENNRLTLRQGDKVLLTAVVGTGSRQFVEEETGRNWYFESPMGSLTVLGKERNPVWIRPDWSYVEENMPVPAENDPDRIVREVLGKYALILGNGYKIHGTKYTKLLGTHFTHGCISVGDKDLEKLYKTVKIGTKVYIY
jgi:lipoprotein-anchoring transpeptidase ErfK/SrfK